MLRFVARTALVLLVLLTATYASAQGKGSVRGTVADETGGVLPGVNVSLKSTASTTETETVTDATGNYRFDNVPVGPAEVTFRIINFCLLYTSPSPRD